MKSYQRIEGLPLEDMSIDLEEMLHVVNHYYSATIHLEGTSAYVDSRKIGEPIELSLLFNLIRKCMWDDINEHH